jgi:hypothetical protein
VSEETVQDPLPGFDVPLEDRVSYLETHVARMDELLGQLYEILCKDSRVRMRNARARWQ